MFCFGTNNKEVIDFKKFPLEKLQNMKMKVSETKGRAFHNKQQSFQGVR